MDIGFFINYDDLVVQLPVNPESVDVNFKSNNEVMEVIKLGDINILRDKKLTEISFDSFFPYYDWFPAIRTRGEFRRPEFYKKFFTKIQEDKKPCRLVITGLDINLKVSIESFSYTHKAGEHEDAYYSISLKEYVDYNITQVSLKTVDTNKPATSKPAPAKPVLPAKITIGCSVILNGRVHYTSYGDKPGRAFSNYKGKINFINLKGSHPYHVTTPSGGWLGWVTKESVVLA